MFFIIVKTFWAAFIFALACWAIRRRWISVFFSLTVLFGMSYLPWLVPRKQTFAITLQNRASTPATLILRNATSPDDSSVHLNIPAGNQTNYVLGRGASGGFE